MSAAGVRGVEGPGNAYSAADGLEKPPPVVVSLGDRTYEVHVYPGALQDAAEVLLREMRPSRAVVVTGTGIVARYGELTARLLAEAGIATAILRIRSGERYKTLATVVRLYSGMLKHGLDRSSVVVAVGGGVVCDTAGFAAGTYMRGVALMLAPTTLLAQVDAGIGGKTGVNLPEGKNLVGVFHQPKAVIVDTATLATLPPRAFRSGLAEVVKHGFIRDPALAEAVLRVRDARWLRDAEFLSELVRRSLEIKAAVVMADERESGPRAMLNFGHTVGHAIETLGEYRRWTHGEAVAMGMAAACYVGEVVGITPPSVTQEVVSALRGLRLPVDAPEGVNMEALLSAMKADKKARAGTLRFVLLRAVGEAEYGVPVEPQTVRRALERWRAA